MDNSIEKLLQLANQGDISAQTTLGINYYRGDGIEKDYKEAVKWLTKAAFTWSRQEYNGKDYVHCENVVHEWTRYEENLNGLCKYEFDGKEWCLSQCTIDDDADFYEYAGNDTAILCLSECYLHGHGIEKSLDRSIGLKEFCTELILRGLASGDYLFMELAEFYAESAEPNHEKAIQWWRKAAARGFPKAQYNLAYCYYKGIGVNKDEKHALECLKIAIDERSFAGGWELLPAGEKVWCVKICKLAAKLGYNEADDILLDELT